MTATIHNAHPLIRTKLALAVSLAMGVLALGAGEAQASTPSPFASLQQPISVAGTTTGRLLATRFCVDRVLTINQAGTVTKFADLPSTGNSCLARDVVVSPGRGGFQRGYVFAVQQQTIYKIPPTGGSALPFVTIPSLENSETSMTFDTVGSFEFALIVTDRLGEIWKVTSAGVATMITDVGHQTEGPAVAPMTFAPFGGQILVTDDFENSVFAVSPTGVETPVATYPAAESVVFIPRSVCEFGSTGGAYFVASQFGNTIYKFPAGDFAGLNTKTALVLTKGGTIGKLVSVGGSVQVSDFEPNSIAQELESGSFYPCT